MNKFIEGICQKIDQNCISDGISKRGCRVKLTGSPTPHLIIDLDKPESPLPLHQARCDYLFFAEDSSSGDWVVPVELKNGNLDASYVVKQLAAGAKAAERLVEQQAIVTFRPIVACKAKHRAQLTRLKKPNNLIKFHSRKEKVRIMNCGEPLRNGLCK